jgi:hypothetical protein
VESSFPRCFQPLTRKSGGHCLVAPRNGFAAAKLFVEEGAYVFITGRRQKKLDGAAKAIGQSYRRPGRRLQAGWP